MYCVVDVVFCVFYVLYFTVEQLNGKAASGLILDYCGFNL